MEHSIVSAKVQEPYLTMEKVPSAPKFIASIEQAKEE